jgi:hypothetical protein
MNLVFLDVDEALHRLHEQARCVGCRAASALDRRFVGGWIYHDLSIEGCIFRGDELERGLDGREGDNWCENQLLAKVRNMERTIRFVCECIAMRAPFDLELIKQLHRHVRGPQDECAGRYRKDSGDSCAFRHDVVRPKGISYRLRRLISQVEQDRSLEHPIARACDIHRQLLEVFPFANDNGIVARMAMNFWIMRHGYPPAVIHVQDRQQYFDSYLAENGSFARLIADSVIQSTDAWLASLHSSKSLGTFYAA